MNYFYYFFLCSIFSFSQVTHTVNAGMYYYEPANITINQGDIVVWINDGGTHDVNGLTNSITGEPFNNPEDFSSNTISEIGAEIYTHTFNTTGFYNYDCSVYGHASAGMVGTITVNSIAENSILGIWSYGEDFLYITENELIIFFYEESGCLIELIYPYNLSKSGVVTLTDPYYGYEFDVEMFVDNNGNLNVLPPEEDTEIWVPYSSTIDDILAMVCSTVDITQMIGQWELSSLNGEGVNTGLHYMEIFDNGTTFQYDFDIENNCFEIIEITIDFYNDFGGGVVTFSDGTETEILLNINENNELLSWINGQNEIWQSSSFDPTTFIECGNISSIYEDEFKVTIFPNPSKDNIHVQLSHSGTYDFDLMDIEGKKIFHGSFNDQHTIDISALSKGTYLLHIFNSSRSIINTVYIE